MLAMRTLALVLALLALTTTSAPAGADPLDPGAAASAGAVSAESAADCGRGATCPLDEVAATGPPGDTAPQTEPPRVTLLFFWGVGCPHCEQAKPFVARLGKERPRLTLESIEVRQDRRGRARFVETMRRLGVEAVGIPTFVVKDKYVVGFLEGTTEKQVTALVDAALDQGKEKDSTSATRDTSVTLPWVGEVDAATMSLPTFTLAVGFIDGVNPCAIWVLLVLLGILAHVRSTSRLFLVGGTFVVMSGAVYFAFMTAWLSMFELVGLSRSMTMILGVLVLLMGLINLKELVWFKRGVSLTIPDKVKPKLYRKMRGVANAVSLPAAFLGVAALAFFVNLIELGCTLGLPAVYTRVLSLREQLTALERYGYLLLYNLAYIVPLALVVVVYALTLHRWTLSERGAKVLKGVSGGLLVVFGLLFLVAPEVLEG